MKAIVLLVSSILGVSQAGPLSSIPFVNIKQPVQDTSYVIQGNHGIATGHSSTLHQQIPAVKSDQPPAGGSIIFLNPIDNKGIQHQEQVHEQDQGQIQPQGQNPVSEQIAGQNVRSQDQLKAINYVPTVDTYQIVPSNIQYGFVYPYGVHYPINLIRIA